MPCSLPPSSMKVFFLETFFPEDGGSTFFRTFVDVDQTTRRYIPKDGTRETGGYTSRG
jgi:hypothetical protein